ncbi:YerC/YecD family TrpR-related protein [Citroniella saccharovorans]|uniref:YerC/YecD family TrpR-related protein n=1 Tax=Citroniella saccharovorans TaxID=2053367 RepID=A0AAW9MUS8_9FIRM|nr:YerC/YecD family TrpR-related protein [Citroniella saccharovorans]MEB3429896.1 YerC/YecD family TrpR-related protein [Citroniella saccharovorans]
MTNPKYKSDELEEFFEAVLMLETLEDCYKFFEDICTVRELNSISQRLEVAKLLKIRKTYSEIEKETGASTATISRVNRALHYGADGYDIVLDNLIAKGLKKDK